MGGVVQINPTSEALHVSRQFSEMLYIYAQDFELKYCWLEPEPEVIEALNNLVPDGPEEARAIREIIHLLERGEDVEILYGY